MNVSLTPQLEKLVARKVKSGMYSSASEVVRASLRLLEQQTTERDAKLEALRKDVQAGIAQADAGQFRAFDEAAVEDIKRRGRERLARESAGRARK